MERLFLVDQTLDRLGGSDFEYLRCLVGAANDEELSVSLGVGKRFRWKQGQLAEAINRTFQSAKVLPSFRSSGNRQVSWLGGMRESKKVAAKFEQNQTQSSGPLLFASLLRKYNNRAFRLKRRRQISRFACDCNRFFRTAMTGEFQAGDHVFFSNVSELELMGLAVFLANTPSSSFATWHLQFRHDLMGNEPAIATRTFERKVRSCFMASLSRIPDHDLRFYCLSTELVEQYERLELANFSVLPYPISPAFKPTPTVAARRPVLSLQETQGTDPCDAVVPVDWDQQSKNEHPVDRGPVSMIVPVIGDSDDKAPLNHLLKSLLRDYLSEGLLQVVVPSPKKKNWRGFPFGNSSMANQKLEGPSSPTGDPAIQHLPASMSQQHYSDSIRESDFALLLPGARSYSQNAKVFGELLSCGKPAIVPAGSFMARKLQPAQDRHIISLRDRLPGLRTLNLGDLRYGIANVPLSGGVLSFDRGNHPFRAEVDKDSSENVAVVRFRWHNPQPSHFARIRCTEEGIDGNFRSATRVVPQRQSGYYALALFRLELNGSRVRLEFENAFDDSSATIRDLSIELFQAADLKDVRLGAGTLIYADPMSIEEEIIEVVENIEHYQRNAERVSQAWWHSHDPHQTLERIVGSSFLRNVAKAA